MFTITNESRKGFTLIELLVVVAIIAILAAILFPVFAKVREKARQTSCSSNLKQLALGLLQYTQDFDETYPNSNDQYGEGWASRIYPYVKNGGLYGCPSDPTSPEAGYVKVSYAGNANMFARPVTAADSYPLMWAGWAPILSLAQQTAPANTVMLFEIQNNGHCAGGSPVPGVKVDDPLETSSGTAFGNINGLVGGKPLTGCVGAVYATGNIAGYALTNAAGKTAGVHTDGANYAASDGHVKWLKPNAVSGGIWAADPNDVEKHYPVNGVAAGTASLKLESGSSVTMTFSPI